MPVERNIATGEYSATVSVDRRGLVGYIRGGDFGERLRGVSWAAGVPNSECWTKRTDSRRLGIDCMNTAATGLNQTLESTPGAQQFVGFEIAGQKHAFRIEQIREIVIPVGVTRIPEVPPYMDGVSNLRGEIIPIINLRVLFGLDFREIDAETRIIVVNVGSRAVGCNVDSVSRVIWVASDQIQAIPDTTMASGGTFIDGFAHVGDELFILLDVDQMLDPENLDKAHRVSLQGVKDPRSSLGAD